MEGVVCINVYVYVYILLRVSLIIKVGYAHEVQRILKTTP